MWDFFSALWSAGFPEFPTKRRLYSIREDDSFLLLPSRGYLIYDIPQYHTRSAKARVQWHAVLGHQKGRATRAFVSITKRRVPCILGLQLLLWPGVLQTTRVHEKQCQENNTHKIGTLPRLSGYNTPSAKANAKWQGVLQQCFWVTCSYVQGGIPVHRSCRVIYKQL